MEIFIGKHLQVAAYSFILGLIFGGLYDIIRISHILCGIASYTGEHRGMKRGVLPFLLFFLGDVAYTLTVIAVFSVFLYWQVNGKFLWFLPMTVLAGFAVYSHTVGRIVMAFSEAITRFLRLAALWLVIRPAKFVFHLIRRIFSFVWRQTFGRILQALRKSVRAVHAAGIRKKFRKDVYTAVAYTKKKELP